VLFLAVLALFGATAVGDLVTGVAQDQGVVLERIGGLIVACVLSLCVAYLFYGGRYTKYVLWQLYDNPSFFMRAMQIRNGVVLAQNVAVSDVPKSYSIDDHELISSLVDDEQLFVSVSEQDARRLLGESEVRPWIERAITEGKLYNYLDSMHATAYAPPTDSKELLFDFVDVASHSIEFFTYIHRTALGQFTIHPAGGDALVFVRSAAKSE
jgi:hypothetical protein